MFSFSLPVFFLIIVATECNLSACLSILHACNRYRDNRHVSMGAEKWLDIELWNSPLECFEALRRRGYRIATTHLGIDTVSTSL